MSGPVVILTLHFVASTRQVGTKSAIVDLVKIPSICVDSKQTLTQIGARLKVALQIGLSQPFLHS